MGQRGTTLLEVLAVTAVLGILLPVLATLIYNISTVTLRSKAHDAAVTPIENAARWLTRDIPIAQASGPGCWCIRRHPTTCLDPLVGLPAVRHLCGI